METTFWSGIDFLRNVRISQEENALGNRTLWAVSSTLKEGIPRQCQTGRDVPFHPLPFSPTRRDEAARARGSRGRPATPRPLGPCRPASLPSALHQPCAWTWFGARGRRQPVDRKEDCFSESVLVLSRSCGGERDSFAGALLSLRPLGRSGAHAVSSSSRCGALSPVRFVG